MADRDANASVDDGDILEDGFFNERLVNLLANYYDWDTQVPYMDMDVTTGETLTLTRDKLYRFKR